MLSDDHSVLNQALTGESSPIGELSHNNRLEGCFGLGVFCG
jgi:hypothetical protein